MFKRHLITIIFTFSLYCVYADNNNQETNQPTSYEWAVIGSGPGGISAMGVLLDNNVKPENVLWIDPEFNIGRLKYYPYVPGNTLVKRFLLYFKTCKSFASPQLEKALMPLKKSDQDKWCLLAYVFEPLRVITNHFRSQVNSLKGMVTNVAPNATSGWNITVNNNTTVYAKKVILATGSHPKQLNYPGPQEIPLDIAFNPYELKKWVEEGDVVAVFGNAHSGILAIKNLSNLPIKHIYNFYKQPLMFAEPVDGLMRYDHRGLTSATAEWARCHLEGRSPENITSLLNTEENIKATLPECTKVIYAIGFQQNPIPGVHQGDNECHYDGTSGMIAPGLFGLGIAFPEVYAESDGSRVKQIGLMDFVSFAKRVVPLWINS